MQRLKVPFEKKFPEKPFEVDEKGKITEDSIDRRQGICRYDYMGSSEFEAGSLQDAFKAFYADREKLNHFSFLIKAEDIEADRFNKKTKHQDTTFYVICRTGDEEEVMKRVRVIASGSMPLQENAYIRYVNDHDSLKVMGWFELDNGYWFFADKDMFEGMYFMFTGRRP